MGHPFVISYVFPEDGQISKPASHKRSADRQESSFGSCCRYCQQAFLGGLFLFSPHRNVQQKQICVLFHRTQGKRQITKGTRNKTVIALLGPAPEHSAQLGGIGVWGQGGFRSCESQKQ